MHTRTLPAKEKKHRWHWGLTYGFLVLTVARILTEGRSFQHGSRRSEVRTKTLESQYSTAPLEQFYSSSPQFPVCSVRFILTSFLPFWRWFLKPLNVWKPSNTACLSLQLKFKINRRVHALRSIVGTRGKIAKKQSGKITFSYLRSEFHFREETLTVNS